MQSRAFAEMDEILAQMTGVWETVYESQSVAPKIAAMLGGQYLTAEEVALTIRSALEVYSLTHEDVYPQYAQGYLGHRVIEAVLPEGPMRAQTIQVFSREYLKDLR